MLDEWSAWGVEYGTDFSAPKSAVMAAKRLLIRLKIQGQYIPAVEKALYT